MQTFEIRPTTYADITANGAHLVPEHWDEVALNKEVMVLNPDDKRYRELEAAGAMFWLGAFADGEIVGYSGNFIGQHIHFASLRNATNDVLFVAKSHRKSPLGLRLIRETEREARRRGARMMSWHAKENTTLAEIMPRLGYKLEEIVYAEQLEVSHFQLVAKDMDVEAALGELDANADLWDQFTERQDNPRSPHHDTRSIILRGPKQLTVRCMFHDTEAIDYPAIEQLPAVAALARMAIRRIGAVELGRVMVANLKAGGYIDRHLDRGTYAKYYERFHVSLRSEPGNVFTVEDETIHMQPGELWRIDHLHEHEVRNDSNRDRIHLIIDARK